MQILLLIGPLLIMHGAYAQSRDFQAPPSVQLLTGNVDRRVVRGGKGENRYNIIEVSRLKISKVSVSMEEDGTTYAAYLNTSTSFGDQEMYSLLVRVGDKIFIPSEWGGKAPGVNNSVDLRRIDAVSAQILNGLPLLDFPKGNLEVVYLPDEISPAKKGSVFVNIRIENVCKSPLTCFFETHGGQNYACRNTQLSFTATRDGAKVPPNSKPLPAGFISSPFTLQPNAFLRRREDLAEWLHFDKPGNYLVSVSYAINIQNPLRDTNPAQWWVTYQNQFNIQITP